MGGLAAALLADVLGGLLLILGGPAAIWRTLWVFWAESAAAGIVATVSLRRGMASLSDEAWLDYAAKSLDARLRRGPSQDETRLQFERNLQQSRDKLAALAALDRRTPEGATAFAQARATEGNLASGIFGCAFVGFSVVHAVFLLMIAFIGSFFTVWIHVGPSDPIPFPAGDITGLPVSLTPVLAADSILPLLVVMALVFAVGLSPLWRSYGGMAEGESAMKEALTRTFILQIVLILGAIPAVLLGSAPLAIVFVGVKTVADLYPLWRRRQSISK
jgi:hypothetical protein